MKPTKCPARGKKITKGKKSERREEERKYERKNQDCCVAFKPKILKFCFLRMPELCKLIFCMWIKRLKNVRVLETVLWYDLALYNHAMTRKPLNLLPDAFFGKIPRDKWVNV